MRALWAPSKPVEQIDKNELVVQIMFEPLHYFIEFICGFERAIPPFSDCETFFI